MSRPAVLAILLVAICSMATPASLRAQANFDCRAPRSETVSLICNDPDLSAIDREVDQRFRETLRVAEDPERLRDNQTGWISGIDACGSDRQCVESSLRQQIEALAYVSREVSLASSGSEGGDAPAELPSPYLHDEADQLPDAAAERGTTEELHRRAQATVPPSRSEEPQTPSTEGQMAFGGLILLLIGSIVVPLLITKAVADHSARKYGWPMILNWWNLLHLIGIITFFGMAWVQYPIAGAVVAVVLWTIVLLRNISKTSLMTGLVMTILQPFVVVVVFFIVQMARAKPAKPYNYINSG